MKRMRGGLALFAIFTVFYCVPSLAAGYKVEKMGPCTLPDVADTIRATLNSEGMVVSGADGTLFEVWMRNGIPLLAGASASDYSGLANGTFVGVIRYTVPGGDYKGHAIRSGVYLMRFQNIPQDGNHMGVSPSPEFFVLTSPEADKDPATVPTFDALMALCRKASGSNHPHALYLTLPAQNGEMGFEQEDSNWFLEGKTKAVPEGGTPIDLPFALTLIGKSGH